MTKEERRLWYEYLHNYPIRFCRQVTCGNYILDFYCAAAKLAIELDGSQHYEPAGQAYDAHRSACLEQLGIQVLRFSNSDVLYHLRGVCEVIDAAVSSRTKE
ncbi:MAG: endonuclease domain-containing protein [Firmicutes bacterium]|nr:endonuclease domain-containing protein [Clostridiales bacterium]MDD5883984.1 endonuclease domain-containing protein [Bacillota bacterium]